MLADFLVECTIPEDEPIREEGEALIEEILNFLEDPTSAWKLYVDGSSNQAGSGAGLLLMSSEGIIAEYTLWFKFSASNNEAVATGLRIAKELGVQDQKVYSDSQLVVGHVKDGYEAREKNMIKYLQKVKDVISVFSSFRVQ